LFERPRGGERTLLVHLDIPTQDTGESALTEFQDLAHSSGARIVATVTGRRERPDPRYFVGSGKVQEIQALVVEHEAALVIFGHELSPSQERNLEQALQCRVLDRTGLILDIFAQRARSHEGKLQVELAQLRHLSTRLIRGWTHLERQKGGIGLRGPGETQLETDRRLLNERIKQIRRRLERVDRQRNQGRSTRSKSATRTVSLVGYTNAGKSTLFNRLTAAEVYVADQLFATLDPTLRRLTLPHADAVVLADTVGFISHLPHELVAAFRSTLQETIEADLLLHVIDASDPVRDQHIAQVEQVLARIGADSVPCIKVFNKIDCSGDAPRLERDDHTGELQAVWLSARTGDGVDRLLQTIEETIAEDMVHLHLRLPLVAARLRSRLFDLQAVVDERMDEQDNWCIEVYTSRRNFERLRQHETFLAEWLAPIEPQALNSSIARDSH
jgi:GTP-binding protein HflX